MLAPLTILPVIAIFGVLTDFESIGGPNYWKWLVLFAMYGLGIAWLTTLALGLPIYLVMLRLRYFSYLQFGIVGAVVAVVGGWYLLEPSSDPRDLEFMSLFAPLAPLLHLRCGVSQAITLATALQLQIQVLAMIDLTTVTVRLWLRYQPAV